MIVITFLYFRIEAYCDQPIACKLLASLMNTRTHTTWNTQRILILMIIAHDNDDNEPIPVALHDASEPTQTYSASAFVLQR